MQRVVVGLSGGVDSAVTAWLLKQQGHEVVGIFMKNWEDDDDSDYCSSNVDFVDAAAVADVIGIEIEHVNFAADYKDRVFAEFLREYQAGRTPNPDVLCNAEIKFKAFLDHAMRLGAEKIATGHYARVRERGGRFELLKGLDPLKDQSYFLHRLNQAQLARRCSRWANCPRPRCAASPAEAGLPNAKKKDSTGICFIGERPFREFLNRYLQPRARPHQVDDRGREARRARGPELLHPGPAPGPGHRRREGQGRRRAAVASTRPGSWRARTWPQHAVVVQGHEHPWLQSPRLELRRRQLGGRHAPAAGTLAAKTRYRQADAACQLAGGSRLQASICRAAVGRRHTQARAPCCTTARSAWAAA
jgi:tRNA-specific 2-thiouridylase